ncbi:MAG: hypothetical protein JWP94_2864 [Mucilaginibacter sp.]|nr:hypothetical protein [Mucilaginibacter sp.]
MMRKLNRRFAKTIMLMALLFAVSCRKKINNKTDLINYINDPGNGLVKIEEVGKIKAELLYKPWELMADRHDKKAKTVDSDWSDHLKDKYFFVLSLSANNKELLRQMEFNRYSEMVQVLAFRMIGFIDIIPDNAKPIEPTGCMFQQTYGASDANQILIVFDKAKLAAAKLLNIKIKEFGLNTGDLNFQIATKDINELPTEGMNL